MESMRFKVGDRVRIKSIDWYNENKNHCGEIPLFKPSGLFVPDMSRYCNNIMTIKDICYGTCYRMKEDFWNYNWTDEMIEGLVEEETEPKFKVGDKIKLKSTLLNDIFGVIGYEPEGYRITNISNGLTYFMSYSIEHCYELVEEEAKPKFKIGDEVRIKGTDIGGTIESVIRGQLIVNSKGSKIPAWPEDVVLMKSVEEETALNKWTGLKVELESSKSVIGVSNVESLRGERFMSGFVKAIIPPEGYQFKDENGNVINATKIVLEKKKKEYPKTYEECCKIMQVARPFMWFNYSEVNSISQGGDEYERHMENTLCVLRRLLICRDAYWKIAGEEMGLDGPWEPDWNDTSIKYCLERDFDAIDKNVSNHKGRTFAFPTEEMRDAFYENFKELIEQCKELL